MNRIISIFISLLFLGSNFVAQQKLTLDNCLDILFKQSPQYKMLELQKSKIKLNYKLSSSYKQPILDFSASVPFNSLQSVQDVFNSNLEKYILILNNSNRFSPNAGLSSSYNLPTGGNVNLNLSTFYNTSNSTFSKDRERFQYSFSAGLSHPIFRVNEYRINTEIKEKEFEQTKLSFLKSKNELILKTIEMYYSVLLNQKQFGLDIRKKEKEDEELKEQRLLLKLGKTSEIEFINKKLAVKNSELVRAKSKEKLEKEMNNFLSLLGLNEEELIELEDVVEFVPFNIPLNEALDMAVKNNPAYEILSLNLDISKLNYETKTTTEIEVDLNASTLFSNLLYYLPFNKKLKNYDYRFGVTVKVPILDGGKRNAETELSKIALEEMNNAVYEKEKSLRLIVKEYFSLISSYKKEHLLQKEKLKILKDSYDVYKREYGKGRLTFFELQDYEDEIYEAEKSLIEMVINHNKIVLQLKIFLGQEIF